MAFVQTELKAVDILLHLPRLVHDSDIRSMFSFSWSSKKKRSMRRRRSTRLRSRKSPLSVPKSNIRITLKIGKTSENHQVQNSLRYGYDNKRRCCFCAVNDESSKRPKRKEAMEQSSETKSSGPLFRTPDLNLPLLIEEGEEHCPGGISAERKEGICPRSISPGRDEEDEIDAVRVEFGSDERTDSDM